MLAAVGWVLASAAVPRAELELLMTDDGRWATRFVHVDQTGPHTETHIVSFAAPKPPVKKRGVVLWGDTAARVPFGMNGIELAASTLVDTQWSICDHVFRNTKMLRSLPPMRFFGCHRFCLEQPARARPRCVCP